MKVYVIKRGIDTKNLNSLAVTYCGYLEVESLDEDLWGLCNHWCWSETTPSQCKNLLIGYCNSDVAFCVDGEWYSHNKQKFNSFKECYTALLDTSNLKYFKYIGRLEEGFIEENPSLIKIILDIQ